MPFHYILQQQALWAEHKQQGSNKRKQQTVHITFSQALSHGQVKMLLNEVNSQQH
jgi:hypothetical protein